MSRPHLRSRHRVPVLLLVLVYGGCSSPPEVEPTTSVSAMLDREARSKERVAAIRAAWPAAESGAIPRDDVRRALKSVAWSMHRGTSWEVRRAAIEELLADEAELEDTRTMLRLMLPQEQQWEVLEFVGDLAVQRGWTDFAPALVRSWSRPIPRVDDAERPERNALARLLPEQPVETTVFQVFTGELRGGSEDPFPDKEQRAAWSVLNRIDESGATTRALVQELELAEVDLPLVRTIAVSSRDLGAVPRTAEQLDWVDELRDDRHRELWRSATDVVATLDAERRRGLELRHAAALAWASAYAPELLDASFEEHEAALDAKLHGSRRYERGVLGRRGETVAAWRDDLVWADLVILRVARLAIEDPALQAAVFDIADRDMLDTSTEHGGTFEVVDDGVVIARQYEPRASQRIADARFIAPDEIRTTGAGAIVHFHLHAQRHRNAGYAGPSLGDLEYARLLGRSCIVFTFVEADVLNVDYYQPDGARIDLGTIRRPAGAS